MVIGFSLARGEPWGQRTLQARTGTFKIFLASLTQIAYFLENGETHGVAEGVALLAASPELIHSITSPDRSKAEKFLLYGSNIVNVLSIANSIVPVPHADTTLMVVAGIFKVGEQVFITGAKEPAAGR